MPRIPGVNHLRAVRALEKAGFRIARQGKHIAFTMGRIVQDAGLTERRSPLVRMARVGSVVVGLALLAAVMPGPALAQGCSFAMALGVAVPAGGVPDADRGELKLSAGQTGRLGLECGSKSIRFGVDLESTALGSQPARTFGYGVSLLGLLGRFGVDFALTDDDNAPWVGVGGHAGFTVPGRRARSIEAILYLGRQVDFGRKGGRRECALRRPAVPALGHHLRPRREGEHPFHHRTGCQVDSGISRT